MPWHIHYADIATAGQGHPGESEVNCHLSRFFFWKTIRVDVGHRFDKGGLAVVHVARCANYVHCKKPLSGMAKG